MQDLYSGNMHPMARKKAAGWAHQYLRPYVRKLKKITFDDETYLAIQVEIFNVEGKGDWDVSNKWPWIKWFEDTLTELKKIPDDCVKYVRDSGRVIFHPIEDESQKKLVFSIFKHTEKKIE